MSKSEPSGPGTLYVVATPIGNLDDMSARAIATLDLVDLIACEDTRRTRRLLNHFHLDTPTESYHQFNERKRLDSLLDRLESGKCLALVSDAGTPTLSDPGARLVSACRRKGFPVVSIPGSSALLAAMASSSFAGGPFLFWGFLPAKKQQRRTALKRLAEQATAMVFYESPKRIGSCLQDMLDVFGDRHVYVGRELTKVYEESHEGSLSEILQAYQGRQILGELTIIVAGHSGEEASPSLESAASSALELIRKEGLSTKEAARRIAACTPFSVRTLYQRLVRH